jgi:hypothetical protein
MKWIIVGIVAICLALFFWMWALQDASFAVSEPAWQGYANTHAWTGYGFIVVAVVAFVAAWLEFRRRKRPPA